MIKEETAQTEQPELSNLPDWSAVSTEACQAAQRSLQELADWHQRIGKLQRRLNLARAEQQAALSDHGCDSEERVERIATAQIRER